jgi:hypothetical protein
MSMSRWAGALSMLAALAMSSDVRGDETSAEGLFEAGLADMLAGRYATGCPALAESYRLDPLPGALFTLAECENKWGKLARALTRYRDYLARYEEMTPERREQQGERAAVATNQVDALEGRVPRLRLRAPVDMPRGAVVRLDGEPVSIARLGAALRVDPGAHVVEIVSDEGDPQRTEIVLAEGEEREVLLSLPSKAPSDAMVVAGWSLLGFGAAGIVVGTVAGAVTVGHKGTIDEQCIDRFCSQQGLDAAKAAEVTGAVSTAGFAIGAAALVAGGLMVWLGSGDGMHVGGASGGASAWWVHRW